MDDPEPLRIGVPAGGRLRQDSDLLIDQIQAIDNRRLVDSPLARLDHDAMARVGNAIREVLDVVEC